MYEHEENYEKIFVGILKMILKVFLRRHMYTYEHEEKTWLKIVLELFYAI
jgi:hypothetical protein